MTRRQKPVPKAVSRLLEVIRYGDVPQLREAIRDVPNLDVIDPDCGTALHHAVRLGDVDGARVLLEHGASVDARFSGNTC